MNDSQRSISRRALALACVAGIAFGAGGAAGAPRGPGDLDPSFGEDGRVHASLDALRPAGGLDPRRQGGAYVGGVSPDGRGLSLAAYDRQGSLDRAFGGDGTTAAAFGLPVYPATIVSQGGDRPLAIGSLADEGFALARFSADGELDRSFASDGTAVTRFPGFEARASSAIVTPYNGKVLVGGSRFPDGRDRLTDTPDVIVARYHMNGTLDESFGDAGIVVVPQHRAIGRASALAARPNGQIVVLAEAGVSRDQTTITNLIQLLPDGRLDPSFGDGGSTGGSIFGIAGSTTAGVELDESGAILIGGDYVDDRGVSQLFAARHTPDGAIDPSFGSSGDGFATIPFPRSGLYTSDFDLDRKGRLVIGGGVLGSLGERDRLLAARITPTGRRDPSFGGDGVVATAFHQPVFGHAMTILGGGRILVAGRPANEGSEARKGVYLAAYRGGTDRGRPRIRFRGLGSGGCLRRGARLGVRVVDASPLGRVTVLIAGRRALRTRKSQLSLGRRRVANRQVRVIARDVMGNRGAGVARPVHCPRRR